MQSPWAILRRFRIGIAVVAILLLVYALVGFLWVPRFVQSTIRQQLAIDGRSVVIERLSFNPFLLEARIEGFRLDDAKGAPLLAFKALTIEAAALSSIWYRGLVLQQVRLAGPYVAVVRERDGSINLATLMPPSRPAPAQPAGPPPRIRIGVVVVDDGRVDLKDLSRPQPFETRLSPIHFGLKDFSTEKSYDNAYQFTATADSGEQIEWSGTFSLQPLASSGHFALRQLQAKTAEAYLQTQLPVQLLSGVAALEGRYQLKLDPALSLEVQLPAVTLKQFALGEQGKTTAEPPLAIAELRVADVALSLTQRKVSVRSIEIDGARLAAQRDADGGLSLSRLLPKPDPGTVRLDAAAAPGPAVPQKPPAPAAAPESPWRIGVGTVKLAAAAVLVDDHAVAPATHFELSPINLSVDGYSSAGDAKLKLAGDLRLNPGAQLTLSGELQPQPLDTTLNIQLQGFELAPLQAYLTPYSGLQLKSGQLGAKLQVRYTAVPGAAARVAVSGSVGVSNFVSQDAARQDFLKWRQLSIGGIDYRQTPQKLSIDTIALSAPYARVVIEPDRSLNVSKVISPPAAASPAPAATPAATRPVSTAPAKSKPMPIRIGMISVAGGSVNFADQSIEPQFAAGIVDLAGKITGLSSDPASRARLHLEGNVDRYSPVLIDGVINPLAASQYADVSMSFRNIDLTVFNPYSGRFAGYNIVKGKLTTELRYKIDHRQLDAQHHVIVDQLEFGDATGSKQAVPLPIRLAVSLLKDRNGTIDLNLPVAGSLDDPAFSVGPIVWKVFVNLLTKAVTAPFAAIGSLFGGGEELAYVDFSPGSAVLTAETQAKLGKLAAALVERPQLRLDVPLTLDAAQDGAAIASAELERQLKPVVAPDATPKDRQKALERLYRDRVGKSPDYPDASGSKDEVAAARSAYLETELRRQLTPDAERLQQLAKERAETVQAAILANPQINPERIFISADRDPAVLDGGQVRMELKLE